MTSRLRPKLILRPALALLGALTIGSALPAPSAAAGSFGVQPGSFHVSLLGGASTQAGSHPAGLLAEFEMNAEAGARPVGELRSFTLALAPGLVIDPQAAAQCEASAFEAASAPTCPAESRVGTDTLTLYSAGAGQQVSAAVYDLVQPSGLPAELGVYVPATGSTPAAHLLLAGHISASDFHEYLQAELPGTLDVAGSALRLEDAKAPTLLTLPSACSSATSWGLAVRSSEGASETASYSSPGISGCEALPFAPTLDVSTDTSAYEQPTSLEISAQLPAGASAADLAREHVTLPSGLTLNLPGLASAQPCSAAQAAVGQETPAACPPASQIGSASFVTSILPEAISGAVYLAGEGEAIAPAPGGSSAQYPVYLELESKRYGVLMRLRGLISAARSDGRLEVSLQEVPQLPLSELAIDLGGGSSPLLANPLACATGSLEALLTPYTTLLAAPALSSAVATTGCPASLPFAPTQSASESTPRGGASTTLAISYARTPGEQYLAKLRTSLPRGLAAHLASVTRCSEPQAGSGACPQSSEVGSASIEAGAGPAPVTLSGRLYLTGPYAGAPFGLALVAPASLGHLALGEILARMKLSLEPTSGQLVIEGSLPRAVGGVPLRARRISMSFQRSGFLSNPTDCATFKAFSTLTGFTPSLSEAPTHQVSTPLGFSDCGALAFRPTLAAASSALTPAAAGANLEATLNVPAGEADVRSLLLQLPREFVLRASTLTQACPESTIDQNPGACPGGSYVGSASASTPLLGVKLSGPAILAVHPQTNIPELFLVLSGEGVRLVLSGSFRTVNAITFLDFGSDPDLPISSLKLSLPSGPQSALAFEPRAGVCPLALVMPTTITAWNRKEVKLRTTIRPIGCGVRIVGHKVAGNTAYLTVQTFAPGRISASGHDLATTYRRLREAKRAVALRVSLSARGRTSRRRRPLRVRLRVGFLPASKGPSSSAYVTVSFR